MTDLLVSVRDALEAEDAAAGGASIIDVKEPLRGPLGRADAQTLRGVCSVIGHRLPLSAALGEIIDPPDVETLPSLRGYQFAKIGLAGATATAHWQDVFRELVTHFPAQTSPVAVIYADWRTCAAPPPDVILDLAQTCNCVAVLIDTYDKRRGNLFGHMEPRELLQVARRIAQVGLPLALAGGLRLRDIDAVAKLYEPWLVAVRGAACAGGRAGRVSPHRVAVLARRLRQLDARQQGSSCRTDLSPCAASGNRQSVS